MSVQHNTLFLRLAGPMQSWGTCSRSQLRRTDSYPSKSGVLGLLLCAEGVRRKDSSQALEALTPLLMGVRIDRSGTLDWDYHTAGAKNGIRKAEGGIKRTGNTKDGPIETLLSRRQYLYDASFLVALQGDSDVVLRYAADLQNPVWPVYLGRKCCVPAEPVFAGTGYFGNLTEGLSSVPWRPRINRIDRDDWARTRTLDVYLENPSGSPAPSGARLVYDLPTVFGFWSHRLRVVKKHQVTVKVGDQTQPSRASHRASGPDREALAHRLASDKYLCVFCKAPAEEVHHVSYENYGRETDADLRSLCRICHLACSELEYGHDMRSHRIDPISPALRSVILQQIEKLLRDGRVTLRDKLLTDARAWKQDFFDAAAAPSSD